MTEQIGKEHEYWVKFDIERQGKAVTGISGVRIKVCRVLEKNIDAKFAINLCEDPLYPALCEYVKNNPLPPSKGGV